MLTASATWKHLELTLNYIKLAEITAELLSDFHLHVKLSFGVALGMQIFFFHLKIYVLS